jgi:hypothetical protein
LEGWKFEWGGLSWCAAVGAQHADECKHSAAYFGGTGFQLLLIADWGKMEMPSDLSGDVRDDRGKMSLQFRSR